MAPKRTRAVIADSAGLRGALQGGKQRMLAKARLHPYRRTRAVAPGPTRHLHEGGKEPLGGAKVRGIERRIGIHHQHLGEAFKVVALGQHLRAEQDVDLTRMRGRHERSRCPPMAGHIPIEPSNAGTRKELCQMFFKPLCPLAEPRQIDIAAIGAHLGDSGLGGAVVTHQPVARRARIGRAAGRPVHHAPGVALRTLTEPATGRAREHGRIASTIEKHEGLLAPGQRAAHRLDCGLGQAMFRQALGQAQQAHLGQRGPTGSSDEGMQTIPTGLGGPPALERGRGRSEHYGHPPSRSQGNGEIARGVASPLLLLEGRVVLFIDHHRNQPRQWREHGQARAQNDAGPPFGRGQPMGRSFGLGHVAVQDRKRPLRKALLNPLGQDGRKCNFGDQDQGLSRHRREGLRAGPGLRLRQALLDPAQIDLGLAAARDAMQQVDCMPLRLHQGLQGLALFVCEHPLIGGLGGSGAGFEPLPGPHHGRSTGAGGGGRSQQFGDRGQRHLTQRAVIVAGRKLQQIQPLGLSTRQVRQSVGEGFQALGRHIGRLGLPDDQTDPPASPPGNHHPIAGLHPDARRDLIVEPTRQRQIEHHMGNGQVCDISPLRHRGRAAQAFRRCCRAHDLK